MAPCSTIDQEVNLNGKRNISDSPTESPLKKQCSYKFMITPKEKLSYGPSSAKTEIFDAVQKGDLEAVKTLIQEIGPSVRTQSDCTLLHTAALHNQIDISHFLLKYIHPNVINKDKQTPAHLAAIKGHLEVLQVLLSDDEINHWMKDASQRTYRDLLAVPLFRAVLRWDRSEINELLRLGADPDYSIEKLVDRTLSRELNVKTARQLAKALCRETIVRMFPEISVTKPKQNERSLTIDLHSVPANQVIGTLRMKVKPAQLDVSGPDVYKMNTTTRGYVCILNYGNFEGRPDLTLEASKEDAHNYANVFTKMGYDCDVHTSLTAEETKDVIRNVRDKEILADVGCAIFMISSHGCRNDSFLTSDMKHVTTDWVLNMFKDSECPQLQNKPKLFIFDFCRGYYVDNGLGVQNTTIPVRLAEPLQDVICLCSNGNGFSPYSFTRDGSSFGKAFYRTLAQHSHDKEFNDLYREFCSVYRRTSPSVVPHLRNIGFTKKFFFNPVSRLE